MPRVQRLSRRRWLWALTVPGASLLVSCLSPTLPLPPPGDPTVEGPSEEGRYTLSGTIGEPNAHVQAANMRLRRTWGQYTDDSGTYSITIDASAGDEVLLWYSVSGDVSPAVRVRLPAPEPAP